MKPVTITIFGDICPVADTEDGFKSGDPAGIMSDSILSLIADSDITVGNLECAIVNAPKPIRKAGPVLHAPTSCLSTLAKAGFSALSLANNHIRDCGSEGVSSTIEACNRVGIKTFGAGFTEEKAKSPLIFNKSGLRIAFVSFAEHEFNAISRNNGGASIFDEYEDFNRLSEIKKVCDYLIVLYHGGIEYHPYPSPLLRKRCQAFVRAGADLVLCQHSHCIGSVERYDSATILYGQGNSLFGYRRGDCSWNTGLLVQVVLATNERQINFLPIQTDNQSILRLLPEKESQMEMKQLEEKSTLIASDEFVSSQWMKFCQEAEDLNLPLLLGFNRYFIFLNRKLKGFPLRLIYGKHSRNITHNLLRCVSHREVLDTILLQYDHE